MVDLRQRRATRRCLRRHPVVGKLILACLSWGFSTALTKIVLDQLTPVDVFGIEILVSAIPLALLAVARGARLSRRTRCCINQASTDNLADPAPNSQFPPL
jgi:EamA-like transporter family